jgi:hypothetical protein
MLCKKLLSLLLLLSLLSQSLYSEVVLTDEEANEIDQALTTSETEINLLNNQVTLLQTDLMGSETLTSELKLESISLNNQITLLQKEPLILNNIVTMQNQELERLKTSSKEQKTDKLIESVKQFFNGFVWGALLGLFGGIYLATILNH